MVNRLVITVCITVALLSGAGFAAWGVWKDKQAANSAAETRRRSDIEVTIVEGKRREEIAAQLAAAGVTSYNEFLKASIGHEGKLFPDTYRFFPDTDAREVVGRLESNYAARVGPLGLTTDQLILASIVEREAENDEQRAAIAGVYQNRLKAGMLLQADPTVQYGKDSNEYAVSSDPQNFIFWKEIVRADYQRTISPFNTYLHPSLPPAPLCNPGRKSMEAALSPAKHDYYYFLHKNGEILFSKTLAEHERKQR
jgi:UPF0755 protein